CLIASLRRRFWLGWGGSDGIGGGCTPMVPVDPPDSGWLHVISSSFRPQTQLYSMGRRQGIRPATMFMAFSRAGGGLATMFMAFSSAGGGPGGHALQGKRADAIAGGPSLCNALRLEAPKPSF